jgi:NAD dependent epimerase/dehydratase
MSVLPSRGQSKTLTQAFAPSCASAVSISCQSAQSGKSELLTGPARLRCLHALSPRRTTPISLPDVADSSFIVAPQRRVNARFPEVKSWAGRRVLVTGAGGFIGSHLAERLVVAGAQVRAFVRYNSRNDYGWLDATEPAVLAEIEVFRGDLVNPEAVADAVHRCDRILHLGALIPIPYSYKHPREFVSANVVGTLNMLEACRRNPVERLVQVSTSEVYGTPRSVPIAEDHPIQVQSPYAASKTAADQLALSYARSFQTPVVVARPFNTYGPRQSARAVIPTIITQALTRDVIELGSTKTTRDFLYVDDTVAGLVACGDTSGLEGEEINLGTGVETSIDELANQVLQRLGRDVPVALREERLRPETSEVERLVADWSKARTLLQWQPQIDLAEGLRRTIEWLGESLDSYKPSIYNT